MPNHPDAIGYLNDLAQDIDEPWFKMVCDLAISGESSLDQNSCDTLSAIFTKRASYLPIQSSVVASPSLTATAAVDFLENLSGFSNFKLLEPALTFEFKKPMTLVFGANGSGKSSICDALKLLACPEPPSRPLANARNVSASISVFNYRFRSDSVVQSWSAINGFGLRSDKIKYFDTGIAPVESAVEPGKIVVLTPYKLHVFERTKALTSEFRVRLQEARDNNARQLAEGLDRVRIAFGGFNSRLLAMLDEKSVSELSKEMTLGAGSDQVELLRQKQIAAVELTKAVSEDGLKLLKAEHRELEIFLGSVESLLNTVRSLWKLEPWAKNRDLEAKETAQNLLAKELIPGDETLGQLLTLLRATSPLCDLESPEHEKCPLCLRELGGSEITLFRKYHDLLTGKLEKEIEALRLDLSKSQELVCAALSVKRDEWDKLSTLPADLLKQAKNESDMLLKNCDLTSEPASKAMDAVQTIASLISNNAELLQQKAMAIGIAEKGKGESLVELAKLQAEIEPLEYAQAIASNLVLLKEVNRRAAEAKFWSSVLPSFTPLLKKITDTAKETDERLVISDFEARLNAEYKALSEKPMSAFGVSLDNRGSEGLVTLLPQVGGREINDILSEGEQRLHAMALFFAELETCSQPIIVFDDPVSSFDYNFIANYCSRLRDFALKYPERQIIVLTHNWEFFVQLQLTLNKSGFNHKLSVQVLENCTVVADYTEKVQELKDEITAILAGAGEPARDKKEKLAGGMRRLIESVVNTHVFNNQRHQFKQKSLPVTDFPQFTKLTPLLRSEAMALADLYAKLSISEHDDPRNAYVNTDKATFQSRYDVILDIETAVVSRKQP